jgi:large subunit ribosomal protein L15
VVREHELAPPDGAKKDRKRVGRGDGSRGTYSGRGLKGQKSRSGYSRKPGFEGGQLPLIKRLPRKRGFANIFRIEYTIISLAQLNAFSAGSEVTVEKLVAAGLIKSLRKPVKILANGQLKHALVVKANKFSATAKAQIEAAGGQAEEV